MNRLSCLACLFRTDPWLGAFAALIVSITLAACGGGGSSPATPPAPVAPTISAQPANVTVLDGAGASFSVTAAGDAPLSYQWRRGGVALSNGADVSGATTATLTIAASYALDGSAYSVQVSNAAGSVVSTNAMLTVTPLAPAISTQPSDVSILAGQNATFTVAISGGTAPVSYQWKRNGAVVSGASTASYTLTGAGLADHGAMFSVDIVNPAGTISSTAASLTVAAAGKTWSDPVRVSAISYQLQKPRVAIDTAGNATAVWILRESTQARLTAMASRFAPAAGWAPSVNIDFTASGHAPHADVAMSPGGSTSAIFSQAAATGAGPWYGYETRYSSGVWSAAVPIEDYQEISGAGAEDLRVAIRDDGKAVAAWNQGVFVGANESDTNGVWPVPAPYLDGSVAFPDMVQADDPRMAIGANGHAFAVWWRRAGTSPAELWASRNSGSGWSVAGPVAGNVHNVAAVAVDENGNAMAVWTQTDTSSGRHVLRASRFAGASWSAPQTLSNSARDASYPQIAADGNGRFAAVWSEATSGIWSARYSTATTSWGAATRVQPASMLPGSVPKIGMTGSGDVIVAWLQPQTTGALINDLYACHCETGGTCGTPIKLNAQTEGFIESSSYQEPHIAVNTGGDAVLVWHEMIGTPSTQAIWARTYR